MTTSTNILSNSVLKIKNTGKMVASFIFTLILACACTGGDMLDEAENATRSQEAAEFINSVETEAQANSLEVSVTTNKGEYTTTVNNIIGVDNTVNDTVMMADYDEMMEQALPTEISLAGTSNIRSTRMDGSFKHIEMQREYVLAWGNNGVATMHFIQDQISFNGNNIPLAQIQLDEIKMIGEESGDAYMNGKEYNKVERMYQMGIRYQGTNQTSLMTVKVVFLYAKQAIVFNNPVVDDYEM